MKFRKKPVVIEAYQTDEELDISTLEGVMHASKGDWIITGVNGEKYPCKPDIFEKTYEAVDGGINVIHDKNLTFSQAIELMKKGMQLQRVGWNGKNQYIELAKNISYTNAHGEVVNAQHDAIGNQAIAFVGTSGVQLGWLASQADMLAEDWQIAQ